MRDIRAARFTPLTFASDITRTPFVFVQVDPVVGRPFPMELIRHFERHQPGRFSYGSLPRPTVRTPTWWAENFRSGLGSLRHGVSDGTWLFDAGLVAGHHSGVSALIDEGRFVAYFQEIIDRKLGVSGRSERSYTSEGWGPDTRDTRDTRTPPPPPPPPTPAEPSPFLVLGVVESATDEQIREAWREQMKLNHPDRVAHLSPALQKFALAQTMEVQRAFDTITRMRGGKR